LATVRIYKVAELLNTTSQESDGAAEARSRHRVKSASSTIEEVVARQFVDRLARLRNIQLPGGDIFAETPVVKGKKGGAPAKKPAEPVKPAAPALPPPRLVKTVKPVAAPVEPEFAEGEPDVRRGRRRAGFAGNRGRRRPTRDTRRGRCRDAGSGRDIGQPGTSTGDSCRSARGA